MEIIERHRNKGPTLFLFFTLPFSGLGSVFLYLGIFHNEIWNGGEGVSLFFLIPFCSIFIIVGLAIGAYVEGFKIDPLKLEAYNYRGLVFPIWWKRWNFSEIREVHNTTNRALFLVSKNRELMELYQIKDPQEKKQVGERISQICQVPFHDIDD